jgi:AbrB family looped-hinge helix DNA binding protein
MVRETATIGRRGQTVIPASLRKRFGIEEGRLVIFEETPEGILIRPAVALPVETYTPRRRAEFLLTNATDRRDYAAAVKAVKAMGLDPATIPHRKPRAA